MKTIWNVEECQENFDDIMEDVQNNGTIHTIIHEDRKFLLMPYDPKIHGEYKESDNV